MKPLVLIQAREGGTRFPGKIHHWIGDRTMLQHVVDRVIATGLSYRVALAERWPEIPEEDVLTRFATLVFALPEYYDPIIRVTADCPMLDRGIVRWVLDRYLARLEEPHTRGSLDAHLYWRPVGTGLEWDGLDVEVFSRNLLMLTHQEATRLKDREHVTSFMRRHFQFLSLPLGGPALRWSVDDREGLEFVQQVFAQCEHCRLGVPHHTNASGSIGGSDRHPIWDLHHLDRGDLVECTAHALLMSRTGGPVYVSR